MHKLENLEIWKKSMNLVELVYLITPKLSSDEKYGLAAQIKRCATSTPSNIAEGIRRSFKKEFTHFLNVSNSSTYEL